MIAVMANRIAIHGFETSNNIKVRVALGYKGIDYTFHTIDPGDRDEIVRLSGQYLTPVLVHTRDNEPDRVVTDSGGILRYLDQAFPDTPRLYGNSRDEQWAIEDHELFARAVLAGPMMDQVHRMVSGEAVSDAEKAANAERFAAAALQVAERLGDREWLVGDSLTAADIHTVAVLVRIQRAGLFPIPPALSTPHGQAWIDRVMAHDRGPD